MVTDKTLTNMQIDAVYISAQGPGTIMQADADLMQACTVARNTHGDFTHAEQAAARVMVAAAYNTRIGSTEENRKEAPAPLTTNERSFLDTTADLNKAEAMLGVRQPEAVSVAQSAAYHAAAIHWDEYGKPRAKHPPCLICGADEIGSLYDGAWCHCCAWRGPLLALLAHAKERTDADGALVTLTEERDRLSAALEQAARDGEEFHRMQDAIIAAMKHQPGECPDAHRESYVHGWINALDFLIGQLRSEGLMPS